MNPRSLVLVLLIALSGCGGTLSSHSDTTRAVVEDMQHAIAAYDRHRPADLASIASACRTAFHDMGNGRLVVPKGVHRRDRKLRNALQYAYTWARQGFRDCAVGAQTLNYPVMARANREISGANGWLKSARSLDH